MFRGISSITLDEKGRIAMPARYRERLQEGCGGHLVATIDTNHRCLLLYPAPEWERIEKRIEALPDFDPKAQGVKRLLLGHANDLEMDSSGRLLLPQELRQYARLERQLSLVGQGKKLELWDQEAWGKQREQWLGESTLDGEVSENLRVLSL